MKRGHFKKRAKFSWPRANSASQVGMHAAMMFFFITLGILTLKCLPVIHRVDATVTDVKRVVLSFGGTAAQLRDASQKESKSLADIAAQTKTDLATLDSVLTGVRTSVSSLNTTIGSATKLLGTTNDQVAKIGPVLDEAKTTVAAVQPVLTHLDESAQSANKLISDPNIPKTIAHVEQVSADGADVADHYKEQILKPLTKMQKAATWIWRGLTIAVKVFF